MAPRFKLRWNIFLSFLGLAILPLVTALWLWTTSGQEGMRQEQEVRLQTAHRFLTSYIERTRAIVHRETRLLAQLTVESSPPLLRQNLSSAPLPPTDLHLLALIANDTQTLLWNQLPPEEIPDLSTLPLLKTLPNEPGAAGFARLGGQLTILGAVPIRLRDGTAGVLLGAKSLDDAAALHLKTLTGAEIAFYDGNRVLGCSRPALRRLESGGFHPDNVTEISLDEAPHTLSRLPLAQDLGVMLALPPRLGAAAGPQRTGIGLAAAAVLATCLLGWWLSGRIVRPLNGVVSDLGEFADGEVDLTRNLNPGGCDEIARLANHFNRFNARLRQMAHHTGLIAGELTDESERIQSTANRVNRDVNQHQEVLQQTATALQEIEQAGLAIGHQASLLADVASDGGQAVDRLEGGGSQLGQQVNTLTASMSEVSDSLRELGRSGVRLTEGFHHLQRVADAGATGLTQLESTLLSVEQAVAEACRLTATADTLADTGLEAARASTVGITALCATIEEAARTVSELGRQSDAIGQILNLVNDFADQTSLLALNASVIASQAGEQGQGFAVVAQEIRELAERTRSSVDDIDDIVGDLQLGSQQARRVMQEGTDLARGEATRAQAAGEGLEELRHHLEHCHARVNDIRHRLQDHRQGNCHVTQAVDQWRTLLDQLGPIAGEQAQELRQLAGAAGTMEALAAEGKFHLRDQQEIQQRLRRTMDRLQESADRIREATSIQAAQCRYARQNCGDLQRIGEAHVLNVGQLDQAVEQIGRKSALLQRGLGTLRP